jgi:hypothetical protein
LKHHEPPVFTPAVIDLGVLDRTGTKTATITATAGASKACVRVDPAERDAPATVRCPSTANLRRRRQEGSHRPVNRQTTMVA